MSACTKHAAEPVRGYSDCPGCEVESLRQQLAAAQAEAREWKRVAAAQAELHDEAEERAERLAEALRELEEREQRDEALLRQALEALERAHQTAMEQTLKARIPECGEFAGIAQDLDFVVAALRERLGDLDDLICPHSAAGRPEHFPAKACILAGSTMNCEKKPSRAVEGS